MVFFPASFSGKPRLFRFGVGGLLIFLVRWVISLFPTEIQFVIIRILGSGLMLVSLVVGGTAVYGHVTGKINLDDIETESSGELSAVARRQAEIKLQVRGPEYTSKVKELVAAQKPEWIVDSSEPLVLLITDKKSLLQVEWDIEEDVLNEMPEADSAKAIIADTPMNFEGELAALKEAGAYDSEMAKRRAQFAAATGAAAPAAAIPPLEEADKLLEAAKTAWQQGNIQGALASAENARKIRAQHLGANHPKVAQVDQMIAAARQKITASATTKP